MCPHITLARSAVWLVCSACWLALAGGAAVAADGVWATEALETGARESVEEGLRLYVAGSLASTSLSTGPQTGVPGPVSSAGLAGVGDTGAEGAIGLAKLTPAGVLRMELEARGRQTGDPASGGVPGSLHGQWSTMANVWHDLPVSERLGVYAGGGVGGGGFSPMARASLVEPSLPPAVTGLAWQAGGGVTYAVNERVTLDLGYRYRGIEPAVSADRIGGSEAILAVRIFEPFRGLLK
jgi:opacity protein-like surface antigen